MPRKILNSVLIKPSGPDCNLSCSYCFYKKKLSLFSKTDHRMPTALLDNLTQQIMEQSGDYASFAWQGGEPTLMGIDFYKKAVEYQNKYKRSNQKCNNGFQTNGTLINKSWSEFLSKSNFLVGLSLDGPEHIHDHYRTNILGNGSWEKVIRARDILLDHNVQTNALIVVNNYSVQFPEEIYMFHKNCGLRHMQFIPCIEYDPDRSNKTASYTVKADEYGKFLITLFKLWYNDFKQGCPSTYVRWFDSLFYSYVDHPAPECTLSEECGKYVVVEHNGDVYSCDFFVEPDWKLGNIKTSKITDMLHSNKQLQFGHIKKCLPPECLLCPWLSHCNCGCPKDRITDNNEQGSNQLCQAFQKFFEYADPIYKNIAAQWEKNQTNSVTPQSTSQISQLTGRNTLCPCGSKKKFKKCCGVIEK